MRLFFFVATQLNRKLTIQQSPISFVQSNHESFLSRHSENPVANSSTPYSLPFPFHSFCLLFYPFVNSQPHYRSPFDLFEHSFIVSASVSVMDIDDILGSERVPDEQPIIIMRDSPGNVPRPYPHPRHHQPYHRNSPKHPRRMARHVYQERGLSMQSGSDSDESKQDKRGTERVRSRRRPRRTPAISVPSRRASHMQATSPRTPTSVTAAAALPPTDRKQTHILHPSTLVDDDVNSDEEYTTWNRHECADDAVIATHRPGRLTKPSNDALSGKTSSGRALSGKASSGKALLANASSGRTLSGRAPSSTRAISSIRASSTESLSTSLSAMTSWSSSQECSSETRGLRRCNALPSEQFRKVAQSVMIYEHLNRTKSADYVGPPAMSNAVRRQDCRSPIRSAPQLPSGMGAWSSGQPPLPPIDPFRSLSQSRNRSNRPSPSEAPVFRPLPLLEPDTLYNAGTSKQDYSKNSAESWEWWRKRC